MRSAVSCRAGGPGQVVGPGPPAPQLLLLMVRAPTAFPLLPAAGGGHDIWYKTYNNKPVPPQYQGPDYITYAGVTIKKEFHAFDYYLSQAFGAAAT